MNADGQGEPVELFQSPFFAWSPDGVKAAYVDGSELKTIDVSRGDIKTLAAGATAGTNPAWSPYRPVWSPDGRQIAFPISNAQVYTDLAVVNADGSGHVILAPGSSPHWTADGRQLIFTTNTTGESVIAVVNAGGGTIQEVGPGFRFDASPDGATIAVYNNLRDGRTEVRVYDLAKRTSTLLSPDLSPAGGVLGLSPESAQVIFEAGSDSLGVRELYLVSIDGEESRKLVQPTRGIGAADWSNDGRDIAFWDFPAIGLEC